MNYLQSLGALPLMQAIGWVLVHFVWQGALIAIVLAGAFRLLRHRSADARYLVGCAGMFAMLAAPVITMVLVWPGGVAQTVALPTLAAVEIPISAWARLAPYLPAFTLVWIGGVFVLQARLILNFSHAQHLKNDGVRAAPPQWEETVRALSARMGVRGTVHIVESTLAGVPMLIGWLRPVILVPTTAFTGLTPAQLRSIIAHELTHVRRHDYVVNLVQALFETLLFYHPAVWWLSGRIRVEREYCCDDVAVRVCGDPLCYAKALSTLDGLRSDERQPVLASTGGSLMDRIRRIAGDRSAPARRLGGWIAPIVVAMSATAAVSAMAVTASARDAGSREAFDALDQVNVVGIVKEFRSDQAELIAFLAKNGVDNRVLMAVLEELGADERVFKAVDRAAEREAYVESQMPEARQWVADELAAGRISLDAAREHLDMARRELRSRVRDEQRAPREIEEADHKAAIDRRLVEMHEHFAREVEAGRLSEAEAERELKAAHDGMKIDAWLQTRTEVDDARRAALKTRISEFHEQLEDDLLAGRITEKQAQERMEQGKRELHALLEAQSSQGKRLPGADRSLLEKRVAEMTRKYEMVKQDLDRALAEGTLSPEDAEKKLAGWHRELDQLQQHVVLERARAEERGAAEEDVKRERAEIHVREGFEIELEPVISSDRRHVDFKERVELDLLSPAVEKRRLEDIHRELKTAVEAGRLTEAEARQKLATMHDGLLTRYRKPAGRYRLSTDDRKALAAGLDRARTQFDKAIADGTMTPEQVAKRLARLGQLEKSLSEREEREQRDVESLHRVKERLPAGERLQEKSSGR